MKKIVQVALSLLLVNFFYFSTAFTFSGSVNTKMIIALFGACCFVSDVIKKREGVLSRRILALFTLASLISLCSFASMTINSTDDSTYLDYCISMIVWLSAAYGVCSGLSMLNGGISIPTIANYIIVVSLAQSILAFLGSIFPVVHDFLSAFIPGTQWLDSEERLYGFGMTACLDTGGIRFAFALMLTAYMMIQVNNEDDGNRWVIFFYIVCFLLISVFGNMVARTTSVGMLLGVVYLIISIMPRSGNVRAGSLKLLSSAIIIVAILFPFGLRLYNNNTTVHKNIRFAFEGVFSLVEKGEWEVASNNKLKTMYVFPDNPHTWIIGDGYMNNPKDNLDYIGEITEGYYKNTDVGYLRFIFYFGIVGLLCFCLFMVVAAYFCSDALGEHSILAWLILLLHFIIWLKVATDCFFLLAIMMCCGIVMRGREGLSPESI